MYIQYKYAIEIISCLGSKSVVKAGCFSVVGINMDITRYTFNIYRYLIFTDLRPLSDFMSLMRNLGLRCPVSRMNKLGHRLEQRKCGGRLLSSAALPQA